MRDMAAGEQHAAGAGLAVERVEQFAGARVDGERAARLRVEQVLELVEDDEARRLRRSGRVQDVEERVCLGLRWQVSEVGRHGFLYTGVDIGCEFEKAGIFVEPEQHRLAREWSPACPALLFGIVEHQRGQRGLAHAADAAQRDGRYSWFDQLRVNVFNILLALLDMLCPSGQWQRAQRQRIGIE